MASVASTRSSTPSSASAFSASWVGSAPSVSFVQCIQPFVFLYCDSAFSASKCFVR
jgi:hypothetical protein